MTNAIDTLLLPNHAVAAKVLPRVPSWVVCRPRVDDRLDLGVSGPMTLVTAATGWGKTQAVARWASTADLPGGLIWLNVSGPGADPDVFWALLCDGLVEAGERQVVPIPDLGSHERRRLHALTVLGATLRRSGPWVVVLDDFPSGRVGQLGRDLEVVLDHARHGLRLVILSRSEPAIGIQRHHVSGQLTRITASELAMHVPEVTEVLAKYVVDATDLTARAVQRHSRGWACGVRLAAVALEDAATTEAALELADRGAADYLASEVLARAPSRVRDLIVRTSVVDEVSPDLARAVVGATPEVTLEAAEASEGFVEVHSDGSFRCHPLLRAAALSELAGEPEAVVVESRRRAADWYVGRGDRQTGLALGMSAQDWPWVARTLVESYVVPEIVTGSRDETVESALAVPSVRAAEPLVEAAILLRRGDVEAAVLLLERATEAETSGPKTPAHRISAAFLAMTVARLRGDVSGIDLVPEVRNLITLVPDRSDQLSIMLDAQLGALETCRGGVHRATLALRHGAASASRDGGSVAGLDCLGQLAMLEAFHGNLRVAERHAAQVLKNAVAAGPALAHAHLSTAWVHLDRAEPTPSRQHLDRAAEASGAEAGPWFVLVQLLTEARLLTLTSQPGAALRLLLPALGGARQEGQSGWLVDQLTLAASEALLAAGEPRRALELVSPVPADAALEGGVLAASAHFDLGELDDALATLLPVAGDLAAVPLSVQVEGWMLEARLAHEAGRPDRARMLVDRALRTAGAETLRRCFDPRAAWLAELVEGDAALRRAHGGFLAGLRPPAYRHTSRQPNPDSGALLVVETLTVREAQVLGLLTEMCSTEEIASELFLSVNTVKTYVRGILRKLGVNRRVDAVRRGRELGLC